MGTIWVQEFTGGLDSRRLPETTVGGVLIQALNGHISRGGEFEKRAAFVKAADIPAGTVGLAFDLQGPVVFGTAASIDMPPGIRYQRLEPANDMATLTRVPSTDLYAGKLYVVGEFNDGTRRHYYDGVYVSDWFDGRARFGFSVDSGTPSSTPKAATASADVVGGSAASANQITAISVAGAPIINAPITHTGNNSTTAAAVAAAINAFTSTPDYTATASGVRVTITAATTGSAINSQPVSVTTTGDFAVGNGTAFSGGSSGGASRLDSIMIDGVSIMSAGVAYTGTPEGTASAIASAINTFTSTPDYTATASGAGVAISTADASAGANTRAVVLNVSSGLGVTPASGTLSGGSSDGQLRVPGSFVRTIGSKVYSVSGPNLHFSGVAQPTKWTTDTAGAGFIDFSAQASGLEQLYAVAEYQQYVAVFGERVTKIQYVDPDPTLNKAAQTLRNTGTASPRSVTQFGDNDIFYLDESGVRSLRARDSSNAASTSDVGVPVDTLITAKLRSLSAGDRQFIIGLIEPTNGRYWLIMRDRIFVFSFFAGAKVSAWSIYDPGFAVDDAGVFARKVYLRSGDKVYVYGGLDTDVAYDETVAEAWLPYLDASKPTTKKLLEGVDAAVLGTWDVSLGMEPTNLDAVVDVARIDETTFNRSRIPADGTATHFGLRFKSVGPGPCKLAAVVIQYSGGEPDAKT